MITNEFGLEMEKGDREQSKRKGDEVVHYAEGQEGERWRYSNRKNKKVYKQNVVL